MRFKPSVSPSPRDSSGGCDLGAGIAGENASLNSFFDSRENARQQSDAVVRLLSDLDRSGERAVLVTHQVNVTALTDVFPASGEVVVVRVSGNKLDVLGRLVPARPGTP